MPMTIKYATRSDGARTAYGVTGDGPLLIVPPGWVSHLEVFDETSGGRSFTSRLAARHTVVMYDRHGCGLSDRDRTDFSVDDDLRDLETVIDALGTDRVRIFAYSAGGAPTIKFAAENPGRVERIAFFGTTAGGLDVNPTPEQVATSAAVRALVRAHWGMGSKALTDVMIGTFAGSKSSPELAEQFDRFQRIAATGEVAASLLEHPRDVRDLVPLLTMPTLVLHRRDDQVIPFERARQLVMLLPNGRLVPLEGNNHIPWLGDIDSLLNPVIDFLSEGDAAPTNTASTSPTASGVRTVLFTDLVGHTEMMRRLGDAKGRDVLREHERITRELLKEYAGAEVKTMGDGFMASFGSVTKAMDCAIALQRAFAAHTESMPEPLHVRVGLNAGEPLEEDGDLFGSTVILASRIAAKAGTGEILIPEPLRHLLDGKNYVYADRGETVLKGFEDAMRLYEVRWRE
jgi:class 3 adenylate cyclase/pimeloyl-ACP methyl ester carboxylesterase